MNGNDAIADREPTASEFARHECTHRAHYVEEQLIELRAFIRGGSGLAVADTCNRMIDALNDIKESAEGF